jgi:hypothetical protein
MFDNILIPLIMAGLFGASAYYITQTQTCQCAAVDPFGRSYILGFSYFAIIYDLIIMVMGNSFGQILFNHPFLLVIPIAVVIGTLVWTIYTLQYISAIRSCKCADSIAEETTYIFAIVEVVAFVILALLLLFGGIAIYQMNPMVRTAIYNKIRAATNSR